MLQGLNRGFALFNMAEKRTKAAELFSTNPCNALRNDAIQTMRELEKNMSQQLRTCWNTTTLEQYLEKGMVPRGLRIKKNPLFQSTEEFQTQWNTILSECFPKLICSIITSEKEKLI